MNPGITGAKTVQARCPSCHPAYSFNFKALDNKK